VTRINFNDVHGTDENGDKYVFVTSGGEVFSIAGASTATIEEHAGLIRSGPSANYEVHFLLHETFNANGTLTAYIDNLSMSCAA
jgi:hypothetical protein